MDISVMDNKIKLLIMKPIDINSLEDYTNLALEQYQKELFNKLNLNKAYKQFEKWLNKLIIREPINNNVIALCFGLFESKKGIELYLTGSNEWDIDDSDWACNNTYFPKGRYAELTIYRDISRINNDYDLDGVYFSLIVSIILINTYINNNKPILLKNNKSLYVATGFDDGDLYNIGLLTEEGLKVYSE